MISFFKSILRWYLFLPLAPIIWSSYYAYLIDTFDIQKLLYISLISELIVVLALILNQLHEKQEYAPIKKFLDSLNIESNDEGPGPLKLVLIASGVIFIIFFLGIMLASLTDGIVFFGGAFSLAIIMFSLIGPFPIFYKGADQILVFLLAGFALTNLIFYAYSGNIDHVSILSSIIFSGMIAAIIALRDYKNTFAEKGKRKHTISNLKEARKARLRLVIFYSICYVPTIFLIFFELNAWALIPLFSAPLAINVILKAYTRWGNELTPNLILSIVFIFYHLLLMLLSTYMIVNYRNMINL